MSWAARLFRVIGLLFALGGLPAMAQDAPADTGIIVYAAPKPSGTMMLLLSGDGGWDRLEQVLAQHALQAGIGVVGLDSHRYFFAGSTPEKLAADLERLLATYGHAWHARRYILAGYSFGADALPFAWPHLPAETRRRTGLIALIGLQPAANFTISVWEMLNLPASDDMPVGPALARLPAARVLCLYGAGDGAACSLPELAGATRIERPGGHDFTDDYDGVAEAVMVQARHGLGETAGK